MTLLDFLEIARRAIVTNTLRSALTTLGIIIGVGSVIVMGAVGAGARSEVDRQISNLGTDVLVVNPTARLYGGRSSGAGTNLPLSEDDLAAIEAKVPGVAAISGQLWASATVVRGKANTWTRIWGVHEQYLEVRNWPLDVGPRRSPREDIAAGRRVALMGQSVVKVLFGDNDPVGQTFRARNMPFTVIGTLSAKGRSLVRRRSRRQHPRADDDGAQVPDRLAPGHQQSGRPDLGEVRGGRRSGRGAGARSSRCCAKAGACRRATTTPSPSAT